MIVKIKKITNSKITKILKTKAFRRDLKSNQSIAKVTTIPQLSISAEINNKNNLILKKSSTFSNNNMIKVNENHLTRKNSPYNDNFHNNIHNLLKYEDLKSSNSSIEDSQRDSEGNKYFIKRKANQSKSKLIKILI